MTEEFRYFDNPNNTNKEVIKNIQIYYSSRTHSQLANVLLIII